MRDANLEDVLEVDNGVWDMVVEVEDFVDDLQKVDVVQYEMVKVELVEYHACEVEV